MKWLEHGPPVLFACLAMAVGLAMLIAPARWRPGRSPRWWDRLERREAQGSVTEAESAALADAHRPADPRLTRLFGLLFVFIAVLVFSDHFPRLG